jgi:hypothetical protein
MKLQTENREWELELKKAVRGSEALLFCLLKKEPREKSNENDGLFARGILHSAFGIQHSASSIQHLGIKQIQMREEALR